MTLKERISFTFNPRDVCCYVSKLASALQELRWRAVLEKTSCFYHNLRQLQAIWSILSDPVATLLPWSASMPLALFVIILVFSSLIRVVGWCDGSNAGVQCRGVLQFWQIIEKELTVLPVGAGGVFVCFLSSIIFLFFLPLVRRVPM